MFQCTFNYFLNPLMSLVVKLSSCHLVCLLPEMFNKAITYLFFNLWLHMCLAYIMPCRVNSHWLGSCAVSPSGWQQIKVKHHPKKLQLPALKSQR